MFADLETPEDASPETPPETPTETRVRLPAVSAPRQVAHDYAATRLSLKAHPISFLREELRSEGVTAAAEIADETRWPQDTRIKVLETAVTGNFGELKTQLSRVLDQIAELRSRAE